MIFLGVRLFFNCILLIITANLYAQEPVSNTDAQPVALLADNTLKEDSLSKPLNTDTSGLLSPNDKKLLDFYAGKGVYFDSTCSQIELYREVYAWLGVRYRYAGLTKRGVDCAGFVKNICNSIYGTSLSGSAGHHFKKCVPIERSELEEGDLVFFKIRKKYISHVGIYLGNGKFAHAAVHGGVMINSLSDAYYNKYYYLSGRLVQAPNKKRW